MVDLGSLVLLMSIFGWKVAVAYVGIGLVIAVAGGTVIEKLIPIRFIKKELHRLKTEHKNRELYCLLKREGCFSDTESFGEVFVHIK